MKKWKKERQNGKIKEERLRIERKKNKQDINNKNKNT